MLTMEAQYIRDREGRNASLVTILLSHACVECGCHTTGYSTAKFKDEAEHGDRWVDAAGIIAADAKCDKACAPWPCFARDLTRLRGPRSLHVKADAKTVAPAALAGPVRHETGTNSWILACAKTR